MLYVAIFHTILYKKAANAAFLTILFLFVAIAFTVASLAAGVGIGTSYALFAGLFSLDYIDGGKSYNGCNYNDCNYVFPHFILLPHPLKSLY